MVIVKLNSAKMNKKAEMGIGTLIIFIAMILVAAVAASVLIQTATSLQNKALLTGSRATSQISTSATTLLLYATNGTDGTIEDFRQKIKLAPGSDSITLSDVLIQVGTESTSADYIYSSDNCTNATDASGDGYYYDSGNANGTFTVTYLVQGTNHQAGYLVRGDIAMLCYSAPGSIGEDLTIRVDFIPKIGTPMMIETATPGIMTSERVYIFP